MHFTNANISKTYKYYYRYVLSAKFNLFYDFNAHVTYFILCPYVSVIERAKHEQNHELNEAQRIGSKRIRWWELECFYLKAIRYFRRCELSVLWHPCTLQWTLDLDLDRHKVGALVFFCIWYQFRYESRWERFYHEMSKFRLNIVYFNLRTDAGIFFP